MVSTTEYTVVFTECFSITLLTKTMAKAMAVAEYVHAVPVGSVWTMVYLSLARRSRSDHGIRTRLAPGIKRRVEVTGYLTASYFAETNASFMA